MVGEDRRLRGMGRGRGDVALPQVRLDAALRQAGQGRCRRRTGGRQWSLHQPGRYGEPDSQRHRRHHRRGAPIHRRPVPAEEDRAGSSGRHPRMYRLQPVRLQVQPMRLAELHPERHRDGGIPPRLASGEVRQDQAAVLCTGGRRRARRHGVRPRARRARLRCAPARGCGRAGWSPA
ncbi:hypothetical protein D3C81_1464070 [compost metagenome]